MTSNVTVLKKYVTTNILILEVCNIIFSSN